MKQPSNSRRNMADGHKNAQRHQSGITSVTTNRTKPHTAATRLYTFILFSFIALIAAFPLRLSAQDAHITVDGKPMLILGGELSNSAATCTDDIDRVMPEMKRLGLNTVLVPAQWDLIEPEEGKFDFSLIGRTIDKARENDLKVVFLWFGAWKNSMSCYAPLWFKEDTKRFPRALTSTGKPLEIASAFSRNVLESDNRAFSRLIDYIAEKDKDSATVIMIQVENEIGMLEDARDHSPEANKLFNAEVPQELKNYLGKNAEGLHPAMLKKLTGSDTYNAESRKRLQEKLAKGGTWDAMFGNDIYTDEIFMAYYYAKYVEQLAKTARKAHNIPLYVNAALNSRGRKPGEYPSAGPLAHLIDVWHCAAPSIDLLAPDIYDTGFKDWAAQYHLHNNPLFIPESRCCENSGVRAMYVFGEHKAIGFCPFAIDQSAPADKASVSGSYALLSQLEPLLLGNGQRQAPATTGSKACLDRSGRKLQTWGLLFDKTDNERIITDDGLTITCRHFFTLPWDARANADTWPEGGGIIIKLAKNDYLIAGNGIVVTFQTSTEKAQEEQRTLGEDGFATAGSNGQSGKKAATRFKGKRIGIGYVDQVSIDKDGNIRYIRRDNGDQSHQGRHARISVGENKILHVKLYEY